MFIDFPIESTIPQITKKELGYQENYLYSQQHLKIGENFFFLNIPTVASYCVKNGQEVLVNPVKGVDSGSLKLFLHGSVFGALLHQQGVLPIHGSSFVHQGKGILICGRSGTGKSSVVAAFCQNKGRFINDDVTPLRITESETLIIPIKTHIKLWDDSLKKLKIENNELPKIRPALNKYYLPEKEVFPHEHQLNHIIILSTHNKDNFIVKELVGLEKYNMLRKQIYRKIYLKGMPETEKKYFKQLFQLCAKVKVTQVIRPQICSIYDTMSTIDARITQ